MFGNGDWTQLMLELYFACIRKDDNTKISEDRTDVY